METLELSRVCRLCGKQAGSTINIFDKRGHHVRIINSVLPIVVHEMDLLPKHMCHSCNYKLQEFHKFYEDCRKTDTDLKSQLSWMRGSDDRGEIIVPMVQISNVHIKSEPPDYDETESTDIALNNESFARFVPKNRANSPKTITFQSAAGKCSRCGCYCGNRNHADETKNCSKTRANRHSPAKKICDEPPSRETIRRNLFATEIFGQKNPRIQTEIPMCNIPREALMNRIGCREDRSRSSLERLGCRQNGVEAPTNDKMAADRGTAHNLRPRKCRTSDLPDSISMKRSRSRSKKNIAENETSTFSAIEIKRNLSEDRTGFLRPRVEPIDYSESKRKNPVARSNVQPQRTGSPKVARKVDRSRSRKNINVASIAVKLENTTFDGFSNVPENFENLKRPLPSREICKRSPETSFEEFLNGHEVTDNSSKNRFDESKSRASFFKQRRISESSRKNSETIRRHTTFFLRSQRGHLRNGKLKEKFDAFRQKPKKFQHRNMSELSNRKDRRTAGKSSTETFKYRDCYTCNARFASSELYMLHGCYANQWH